MKDVIFATTEAVPYTSVCQCNKTDICNKGFTALIGSSGTNICAYCSVLAMVEMKHVLGITCALSDLLFLLAPSQDYIRMCG